MQGAIAEEVRAGSKKELHCCATDGKYDFPYVAVKMSSGLIILANDRTRLQGRRR